MISYMPILKWKKGERIALKELKYDSDYFVPVIQIIDEVEPSDFFSELKEHFDSPVYIDTSHFDDDNHSHLCNFITYANTNSFSVIPYFLSDEIEKAQKLLSTASGIGINVPIPANFDGFTIEEIIDYLSNNVKISNVDLFLDADEILERSVANLVFSELKRILSIKLLTSFRKVIICSTSFPRTLTVGSGQNAEYERFDYKIFEKLVELFKGTAIGNKLAYSDYGVTAFTDSEIDFSKLRHGILPKVKYTTTDLYWILKGQKDRIHGAFTRSYIDMSREIVNSKRFYGKDFSYGDCMIEQKATVPNAKPGNSTNWVTFCANHHLAVVIEQLSKLSEL